MAYQQLPMRDIPLEDIKLDLKNFRITSGVDSEDEALVYLFESEEVLDMAKKILTLGYFDNEVPIVVEETNGSIVVLEGNRRVSALKGLNDPSIAPGHEAQLRSLLKRYAVEAKELPTSIRVLVAASREIARPHVARMHIGDNKRAWSPDQQASFFYSQLASGATPEEIKQRHPNENITKYMKMGSMRRFLKGAKFKDATLHDFVSSNKLKVSVLEYAYRHAAICQLIGVEFAKNGLISPENVDPGKTAASLPAHKLATLEHLVEQFRGGKLDTRSHELMARKKAFDIFVRELKTVHDGALNASGSSSGAGQVGESSGSSRSSSSAHHGWVSGADGHDIRSTDTDSPRPQERPSESAQDHRTEAGHSGEPGGSRGPNHPKTKNTLMMNGLDISTGVPVNLQYRYHELKRINYRAFPLAASILMRSVLETTIKFHFTRDKYEVSGQLSDVMKYVTDCYQKNPKRISQAVRTIGSGTKPGSITWFNLAAHHQDATVDGEEVLAAWREITPLLGFLLQNRVPEAWTMPEPRRQRR